MSRRSIILGTGSALPSRRVTNAELAERVETTHEWIVERTGIEARHIAADGETTATLATEAAQKALAAAGVSAQKVGLIVLATATPDQTFPASATRVQTALGIDDCIAFDVSAVCTGFLYALSVADNMLKGGMAEYALVIGSETFSRLLDWDDRTTCVLFGDGAGAILLHSVDAQDSGVLATKLH
ncbi:MAG TPA: 3-oxoacyl-ACP synthase, partial [Allosphingosinicella sp.]